MNPLLNYLLEATVCLAVFGLFYRFCLAETTFFAWNRTYLLGSFFLAWLIPALHLPLTDQSAAFKDTLVLAMPAFDFNANESQVAPASAWMGLQPLLIGAYWFGVAFFLARLGLGLLLLYRKASRATRATWGRFTLLEHPEFEPSSFFHWIFLPPRNAEPADRDWILAHEAAHAHRLHSLDLVLFQLLKITFWFNPFLRFFEKALLEVHEYQVDRQMTQKHAKDAYVDLLLHLIRPVPQHTLVNNFNQFQLKKRLKMMYRPNSSRLARFGYALSLPLLAVLLVFFACESSEEQPILDQNGPEQISERVMRGEIFDVVEEMPVPAGGMEGWNDFLRKNLTYPETARSEGVEGTVYAEFIVDTEGSINQVELLRGVDSRLDNEALRVLKAAPSWSPGKQKGVEVPVKMRVPIRFKLN
ncbi:TonB family C-terminal domain-containing protein [Cyclobacterium xiamenense]|uniref:TonB family C-terminal domain-containing protein n=1 Tax=Cyclobacterium xiamenense TaxID=1297121 RepID=A0A1H6W5Q7_9BACT|nr:M56 family metallopeptidase [Cyclobacterium xiamenense]SEJ07842.1 TonB family C-terminal domain-containing protein [Cyclobacterium xiamenense]